MIILPTERTKPEEYNPKMLVLFGKPKSGKSSIMAQLEDNLIVDLEDGYRSLSVLKVRAKNIDDLMEVAVAVKQKTAELGHKPYKYITIDNATRLEEMCLRMAGDMYRNTQMGQNWGYVENANGELEKDRNADIRTLPNGAGYLYLRLAVKKVIDVYKTLSDTLILIAHVRDKQIRKNGEEMNEMSVDLAGKLADIVCGEADAIGYIYREKNKTLISFEGGDDIIREARPLHLRGKKFVVAESDENNNITFDLSKVFINKNN